MKKTLAILLSLMLIVGAVFAIAITSSADEPAEIFAHTIQVHMPDGADEDTNEDIVYVGRTPVFEADPETGLPTTTIKEYDATNVNNTLTVGEGTIVLDPATGTVTVTNVTGIYAIKCYTGSMTLVVKGTNTFANPGTNAVLVNRCEFEDPAADTPVMKKGTGANLTITGDGTLNASANAYTIVCQYGDLIVNGDVTLNASSTAAKDGSYDVLHCSTSNGNKWSNLILGGNAKIAVSSTSRYSIRSTSGEGKVIIQDNVDLTVNTVGYKSWNVAAIKATNFEMTGGNVTANVTPASSLTGSGKAICGLEVQDGKAVFSGGKLNVTVNNLTSNRAYGLFFKQTPTVDFCGTEITVDVKNSSKASNNGVISFQYNSSTNPIIPVANVSGGKLTLTGDANTMGMIGCNVPGMTINISGGEISGTADSLVYSQGVDATLNITGGTFDVTSLSSNITYSNTAKTITQTTAANTNAYAAKYVVDAAAKTFKVTGIAAPADLKAGSVTKDDAPISWAAVTDAVGYNVYVDGKKVNDAPVTTTSYTVPVMPNTKYAIAVSAVNPLGGENRAAAISVTTPDGISSRVPPAAPTGLKLVGADAASAVVAWDAVDKAEGYFVYVDGVQVNEEAITVPVYKLTALEAGKEVTVLVKATSIAGKSEESASIKVAPVASDKVTLVEVVLADGTSAYLGSGNTTVNGATGTVAFDAATGTVTVTDVTGVDSILGAKKMTVVFKGASEIGANAEKNVLTAEELIIEGDGSVKIEAAKATYPIFAGKSLVVQGSVKLTMKAPAGSALLHAGRVGGDCSVIVRGNAVLDVSGTGRGLYAAGEKTTVIVTENANVTLETSNDTIAAVCDTDDEGYTGAAGGFVEFSGNAKVLVKNGNCGIRVNFNIKGEHDATVSLICKDNAYVDITAPGQTAYLVDGAGADSKGKVVSVFTVQDNAFLKLTNNGPASNGNLYPALQLKTDGNTVTIDGGTLELVGHPDKACYAVGGKTTYKFDGYKTFVGGVDKASAKDVTKFSTTDKYIMITFGNPPTADVNYVWVAVLVGFSVLTAAGVVIARKKAII